MIAACTCNCGPPPTIPEAPSVSLVLIVGAGVALLAWRGRRRGPPGPRGSADGFRLRWGSRRGERLAGPLSSAVARIVCAVVIATGGSAAALAVGPTTTIASSAACPSPTPSPTSGAQGVTVTVPDAGAAFAPTFGA
jgi:hypothetical protein